MGGTEFRVVAGAIVGIALLAILAGSPVGAGDDLERHAGRIHSISPADGLLIIQEVGANATERVIWVQITNAEVVRVSRDPNHTWGWRERLVRLHMFPVGTVVVVIGHRDPSGMFQATRVEIPKIEPLWEEHVHVW